MSPSGLSMRGRSRVIAANVPQLAAGASPRASAHGEILEPERHDDPGPPELCRELVLEVALEHERPSERAPEVGDRPRVRLAVLDLRCKTAGGADRES